MKAVIQRVKKAHVEIDGKVVGKINRGLLILLGIGAEDDEAKIKRLYQKIKALRIFVDEAGKTNLNSETVSAEWLIVSQFTLLADCRKGNRPSFTSAGDPKRAQALYDFFCDLARQDLGEGCQTGEFGADMAVSLINDGPFTIVLGDEIL